MFINKKILLISLLCCTLLSCSSPPKFSGTAFFTGRICGPHGEKVSGYTVTLSGKQTLTNSGGVFVFEDINPGTYTLTGFGNDWSSFKRKVEFRDNRMITCIQVNSVSEMYKKCEQMLLCEDYKDAEKVLEEIKDGNSKAQMYKFYQRLISFCSSPSKHKLSSIQTMICDKNEIKLGGEINEKL